MNNRLVINLSFIFIVLTITSCASTSIHHLGPDDFTDKAKNMMGSANSSNCIGIGHSKAYIEYSDVITSSGREHTVVYWTELQQLSVAFLDDFKKLSSQSWECFESDRVRSHGVVRGFDIAIAEMLGKKIYDQDWYAATATDVYTEATADLRLDMSDIAGWVVDDSGPEVLVRFIKSIEGRNIPVYDVAFKSRFETSFSIAKSTCLTELQERMFNARQTAIKNMPSFEADNYNTIVLPNIDADGFLVYLLAATKDSNRVVVCGHYRFSISSDGKDVLKTDKLYRRLTIAEKPQKSVVALKQDAVALCVTNLVSNLPLETHVFLNLSLKQPVYVVTADKSMWSIIDGKIIKK